MTTKFSTSLFLAAMLAIPPVALGAPVTFQFELPNWAYSAPNYTYGSGGVLRVTVDNGGTDILGQTYANSQVTGVSLTASNGSFAQTWSGSSGSSGDDGTPSSYISTDAQGTPRFTVPPGNFPSYYSFSDVNAAVSLWWGWLSSPDNRVPECSTFVLAEDGSWAYVTRPIDAAGLCVGISLSGIVIESRNGVPEPATLALAAVGLAGCFARRRRNVIPTGSSSRFAS